MKIEQRSENSYRVRKTYKGKTYTLNFDHKPSQKEITISLAEKLESCGIKASGTFEAKAKEYIDSRENVTSPATLGGYEKILRQISKEFKQTNIIDIDKKTVQLEVSRYAEGRAPKTVKNFYGFITAVLYYFRPRLELDVKLPEPIKYIPVFPEEEQIRNILESVKGTDYSIPFQLGVLGMRRSEVCAAELSDIHDNFLMIDKAYVFNRKNKPIIKLYTKTEEGKREIYLPDSLVAEISQKGGIFDKLPHNLVRVLHEKQDLFGYEHFRFHDLRHFYASYAHEHGMSDANIMASGGWKTDYTMKSIYRHAMEKEMKEKQKSIAEGLL